MFNVFNLLQVPDFKNQHMIHRFRNVQSQYKSIKPYSILCTGPLTSLMISSIGSRKTVFIGTALAMSGYISCAFVSSFPMVFLTYGFIAGMTNFVKQFCFIQRNYSKHVHSASSFSMYKNISLCYLFLHFFTVLVLTNTVYT